MQGMYYCGIVELAAMLSSNSNNCSSALFKCWRASVRSPFCNAKRTSTKLSLSSSKLFAFISDAVAVKTGRPIIVLASTNAMIKITRLLSINKCVGYGNICIGSSPYSSNKYKLIIQPNPNEIKNPLTNLSLVNKFK